MGSSQKVYIRLAAEHGVPFPGAEKYGDINKLGENAAWGNNFSLIKYFHDIKFNDKIFSF